MIYDLLNKNLNFCPTPVHYNKSILKKDLESFRRKIKAFFHNKNEQKQETANKEPSIKSKTKIGNPKNHNTVETFIEVVNKDVVEKFSNKNKLPTNNLKDTDKNGT